MAIKPDSITRTVLEDVWQERCRQHNKLERHNLWDCADPDVAQEQKVAVLGEEFGEVCRAVLELGFGNTDVSSVDLYKELVQTAAVAVAWAESIGRR